MDDPALLSPPTEIVTGTTAIVADCPPLMVTVAGMVKDWVGSVAAQAPRNTCPPGVTAAGTAVPAGTMLNTTAIVMGG
jgi:hypothetical protein